MSIFNEAERLGSPYLKIAANWHNGYPQPEDGYKELCYDLSDYCEECGMGLEQIHPLRLKNEPKWGRRQMFGLNWRFDELFCKVETYKNIFEPLEIGSREVILNKKNTVLETVVQLDVPIVESDLIMEGYPFEHCNICYKKKYLPITVGGSPHLKNMTKYPMFKSKEYFGSGASANKMLFVNNYLYNEMKKNSVRGIYFVPVLGNK